MHLFFLLLWTDVSLYLREYSDGWFAFDLFASEFRRPRLIKHTEYESTSGAPDGIRDPKSTKIRISHGNRKQTFAGRTGGWVVLCRPWWMDGWMGGWWGAGAFEHKQLHAERVQVEWIGSELFRFLFRFGQCTVMACGTHIHMPSENQNSRSTRTWKNQPLWKGRLLTLSLSQGFAHKVHPSLSLLVAR